MEEYKALFEDPEKAQTPPMQEWLPIMQRSQSELRKHPIGIKHLQRVLATVKQDIHNQGYVSEENMRLLTNRLHGLVRPFSRRSLSFLGSAEKCSPRATVRWN